MHEDTEIIKKEISKRVDEIQELQKKRKAIVLSTKVDNDNFEYANIHPFSIIAKFNNFS